MATFLSAPQAYGQSQPLISVLPMPIAADAVPGVNTPGVLGQVRFFGNTVYMLVGITAGGSQWISLGGADGEFNALVVTTTITAGGDITSTGGSITVDGAANIGANLGVAGDGTIGGNFTVPNGSIVAQDQIATTGSVWVGGDSGVAGAGVFGLTNVLENDQGAGDLSIKSTTGNAGDNTGFIKAYIGATVVWIPYFEEVAP